MRTGRDIVRRDALGNVLDPDVKYARGEILRGSEEEAARQQHGLDIISRRISKKGVGSVYNLLGVVRNQPLELGDLPKLGFLESLNSLRGKAESAAVEFLGGDQARHMGLVTNRVSASSVAGMLAMVRRGETVLCASPDGRTHPSVKLGIRLARGNFKECVGYEEVERDFDSKKTDTIVITTITPQLRHLPIAHVRRIVDFGKSKGARTYVDDAHGAIRMVAYSEPGAMALEPDAVALSSDKHIYGPRAGVMAGQPATMRRIRAISLELGVEAQTPVLAGVYRALKNHKVAHIRRSLRVAKELRTRLERAYPRWFYYVNDCAALTDENVVRILNDAAGHKVLLVPQEACSALSMLMLEKFGLITVSTTAAPGAAPYLRLVTWPDGYRLPPERIVEALAYALAKLSPVANDPNAVKRIVLGG